MSKFNNWSSTSTSWWRQQMLIILEFLQFRGWGKMFQDGVADTCAGNCCSFRCAEKWFLDLHVCRHGERGPPSKQVGFCFWSREKDLVNSTGPDIAHLFKTVQNCTNYQVKTNLLFRHNNWFLKLIMGEIRRERTFYCHFRLVLVTSSNLFLLRCVFT